ncbi:MAG: hypothetical protein AAF282_01575 [Cyanobacteria bacterium P01_A01_bin.15]
MERQCIILNENARWKFENGQTVNAPRSFTINDGEAMLKLIEQGLGIGLKSVWNASESLAGQLVEPYIFF